MNLKRFSIFTSIIIAIIIATVITLSCIKIDNGLKTDEPVKFNLYAKTSVSTQYSKTETPSKFNEVNELYKEMTRLSLLDKTLTGRKMHAMPSQDIEQNYPTWKEANKSDYYCLEVIFEEKQSITVSIDGNTKVIDFYGLIMKVTKSTTSKEVAMYFSTSEGTYKSYSTSPILINANQSGMYKYIDKLAEKE